MKRNKLIIYFIILLLAGSIMNIQSQNILTDSIPAQSIQFRHYLNNVGKNNLSLLIEKYNVKIADAGVIAAKVMPDPELTIEASEEVYKLELGYTLELGNKRGARVRLAKSEAELSKLALEHFFQELRAEAAEAFLNAIHQRELLDVKQSSYEYMLQLSRSDSLRFRMGEVTKNDARQSKLEAATLLNEIYAQEAEYKSALAVLNQYMGMAVDTLNIPVGKWNSMKRDFVLSELINTASRNRIDLMVTHKNSEIAVNQLRLARAERRIDLGLRAGYERDWHGFLPIRDMVTVGVSVPLKFSNFNKGTVKAANYAVEQSKYETDNALLQIQTEVSQAFYQYEAVKKQMNQYESGLLEESQKVLNGMVYKYKRGETSILEVLIAQRSYNEVQEQYLVTMKNYTSSLVNLEKVCGVWDIDFE
ncbi:TolC family protein [Dysgonomonas sp.]